jgi:hypothetical protein
MPPITNNSHDDHRPSLANSQVSTIINRQQEIEDDNETIKNASSDMNADLQNDQASYHSCVYSENNTSAGKVSTKIDQTYINFLK